MIVTLLLTLGATEAEAGRKGKKKNAEPPVEAIEERVAAPVAQPELGAVEQVEGVGEPIMLPCDWVEGLTFHYDATSVRRFGSAEGQTQTTIDNDLTVSILKTGNPQTIRYLAENTQYAGNAAEVPQMKALAEAVGTMPIDIVLNTGAVAGIANFEELQPSLDRMVAHLSKGAPPEALPQIEAMFRNPQTATAMIAKEPAQFFAMYCVGLREQQQIAADVALPNPFGGAPIPGISKIWMDGHDEKAGTMTIVTEDTIQPEALKALVEALISQVAPPGTLDDPEAVRAALAELPPIDSVTKGTFVMHAADGFPVSITIDQYIGAEDHPQHRHNTWTWIRSQ